MPALASRIGLLSGEGALEVYSRASELERQGRSILHMELGEPDFHPAPAVIEAGRRALAEGRDRYCAPSGLAPLRAALAEYLRASRGLDCVPEDVVVTSGCKLALSLAMMAVIEPGAEVLYPAPGFPVYPSLTRALGAHPVPYALSPETDQPDLDAIRARIGPATRVLMVCSPNNPTGTVCSAAMLAGLAELAERHDLWVISDEIYARIVYEAAFGSIAALPGMAARTVVIDGFSKSFAMTGWRLGYAVAPAPLRQALEMLVMNTFTCAAEFVQWAAIEALRDSDGYCATMVAEYARRRRLFVDGLNTVRGFRCRPPAGAFYAWVDVSGTGLSATAAAHRMLEEAGVAAIPGGAFGPGGETYLRFSFAGDSSRLSEAIDRLRALFGEAAKPGLAAVR